MKFLSGSESERAMADGPGGPQLGETVVDAVIEVRAGDQSWKIRAGRVREWKLARARQRTVGAENRR